MDLNEFQRWGKEYYESRGWAELDIFIRIGFLAEETGEVARAIRALEIGRDRPDEPAGSLEENKRKLTEELGDVLGNLIVIASRCDIPLEEVFQSHKKTFGTLFEGLGSFPNRPENPLFVPPGGAAASSRRLPSIEKEISSVIRGARHLRGAASPSSVMHPLQCRLKEREGLHVRKRLRREKENRT
ncbi:MAG: hypothetical protein C6W57_14245 [Caldibacillus debilis]|nr:MAG: hypothetical protein C6W57_14245 [Caldibacillus debilis]